MNFFVSARRNLALAGAALSLALWGVGCGGRTDAAELENASSAPTADPIPASAPAPTPAPPQPLTGFTNVLVRNETPKSRLIKASDLPKPFATPSIDNGLKGLVPTGDQTLMLPPGFAAQEWASGLDNPRIIVTAPNGDIFIAESGPNRVIVLRDTDNDGRADFRSVFAENLTQPFGIAFYPPGPDPKYIYIANTNSVVRYPYKNGDAKASGASETIINDLPGGGYNQHWTRNLLFKPDGKKLYVSVGSQTNVGEEEEKRAAILEYNPDGTGYRVYASGLRNAVGMAFHPVSGQMWTAVNERDAMGDDLVPDYATSVKDGGFYGWPWYYIGQNHDPRMSEKPELKKKSLVPDVLFESHVAALGLEFYTANQFPAEYRNSAFVAQHGSWNRVKRSGYQIVRIKFDKNGKPIGGYEPFAWGWLLPDQGVWGRPVDLTLAADGSLLVTDDAWGKVYRIFYKGK